MTVTAVHKDPEALTMTLTAEFEATPERVWELWADPRQLERWWGPPTYPATFTAHDLAPGSRRRVPHDRTQRRPAAWLLGHRRGRSAASARLPRGFANDDGTPNDDFPRNEGRVTIEPIDAGRTRMSIESRFPSTEAMEQVLAMGMEEGLTQAVGQIDAILAEGARSMTTMTEPTTTTLDVPGAVLTYDIRQDRLPRPGPVPDRVADGCRRVRHARRALHRSHDRHLRPARRRAQHEGRPGERVDARAARRRPASDHRRARRRPGRPLRQQRWRGQRARPRREAPGRRPDARRARAAARLDRARSRGRPGGRPGDLRRVPARRVRRRHGAVHRRS